MHPYICCDKSFSPNHSRAYCKTNLKALHGKLDEPVTEDLVQPDDVVLLLLREAAAPEVGAEVVEPPEAAALTAVVQPGQPGDGAPAADAVPNDVVVELLVFLGRPEPLAELGLPHATGGRMFH